MLKKLFVPLVLTLALVLFSSFIFSGCATGPKKPKNRKEALELRRKQIAATERTYKGASTEDVLIGVDTLLRLIDPGYYIQHGEDYLTAERSVFVYLIIVATTEYTSWLVATRETSDGIKVMVRASTAAQSIMPIATYGQGITTWTATTLPLIESSVRGTAFYGLFYKRLDYLLGFSKEWYTCDEAGEFREKYKWWGGFGPMCDLVHDLKPKELRQEKKHSNQPDWLGLGG